MENKKAQAEAARIIRQIARKNQVTEAEARADIRAAMEAGMASREPSARLLWAAFTEAIVYTINILNSPFSIFNSLSNFCLCILNQGSVSIAGFSP